MVSVHWYKKVNIGLKNFAQSITARIPRISITSSATNIDNESFQTECANDEEDANLEDNQIQTKGKGKGKGKSSYRKTKSSNVI